MLQKLIRHLLRCRIIEHVAILLGFIVCDYQPVDIGAEILVFLHKLVSARQLRQAPLTAQVLTEYFKELEEESIKDNFVIIYEVRDDLSTPLTPSSSTR